MSKISLLIYETQMVKNNYPGNKLLIKGGNQSYLPRGMSLSVVDSSFGLFCFNSIHYLGYEVSHQTEKAIGQDRPKQPDFSHL